MITTKEAADAHAAALKKAQADEAAKHGQTLKERHEAEAKARTVIVDERKRRLEAHEKAQVEADARARVAAERVSISTDEPTLRRLVSELTVTTLHGKSLKGIADALSKRVDEIVKHAAPLPPEPQQLPPFPSPTPTK